MGDVTFFAKAAALEERGEPFAIVTFTSGKGHLPQALGAKALVTARGLEFGTVGGGKVEARVIEEARSLLARAAREPISFTWNLQRDLDMTCGGEMSFLVETFFPRAWNVVVYGAGHVGQAVARVLAMLDCRLTVIESRAEWRSKLPPEIRALDWEHPAERVGELPPGAFHVVMTQDHETDRPILAALAGRAPAFVGVIGSKAKSAKLRAELLAAGCDAAYVEKIRCPIGLELGGNVPAEIAISVAAQLLKERT
jgi:xanthine dehydrogenase accessory factor